MSRSTEPAISSPSVLIVIVNYRTPHLVIDCLRSLAGEVAANPSLQIRVVVADGCSQDDSVPLIEAAIAAQSWDHWASLVALEVNGGFSYGNNAVIRPALQSSNPPDYIWLLNPDTVVLPGALAPLVAFLETHPQAGFVGSRLENEQGVVEGSAFRYPSVLGELESGARLGLLSRLLKRWIVSPPAPSSLSQCDWVSGASLMVRRQVFEQIGLLDESFFLYFEEVDLCRRGRQAGWLTFYVPQSRVLHYAGKSTGVTGSNERRRPPYWLQARRHYFMKHLGRWGTLTADLAWALGFLSYRIRERLQGKRPRAPSHSLRDFIRYNFGFGGPGLKLADGRRQDRRSGVFKS